MAAPLSSWAAQVAPGPPSVARENGQRPFRRRRSCQPKKPSTRETRSLPLGTRKSLMLPPSAAGGIGRVPTDDIGSPVTLPVLVQNRSRRVLRQVLRSGESRAVALLPWPVLKRIYRKTEKFSRTMRLRPQGND